MHINNFLKIYLRKIRIVFYLLTYYRKMGHVFLRLVSIFLN